MMNFIGCDVGKRGFDVFLEGKHYKFENNKEGIEEFIARCKQLENLRVVLEPTGGYERKLLRELAENKIQTSVVNPFYVRNFSKSKKDLAKTDKIDCKVLAEYGEKMEAPVYVEKPMYCLDLEELTHRRDNIVEMIKQEKQRLEKEPSDCIKASICKVLVFLEDERDSIEKEISKSVKTSAEGEKIEEILCSEKGIGKQTAAILIGSLPELGKLDNRQIAKLCGLAPMSRDSGSMHGKRSIRGGRERVREALYMASISAMKSNPKVSEFYKRLREQGKPGKVAMVAVARKLLVILNSKMRCFYAGEEIF
jgi:transposase